MTKKLPNIRGMDKAFSKVNPRTYFNPANQHFVAAMDALTNTDTKQLLKMAETWASFGGSSLKLWQLGDPQYVSVAAKDERQSVLIACALELRQKLSLREDFAQAVLDLGLEEVQ